MLIHYPIAYQFTPEPKTPKHVADDVEWAMLDSRAMLALIKKFRAGDFSNASLYAAMCDLEDAAKKYVEDQANEVEGL